MRNENASTILPTDSEAAPLWRRFAAQSVDLTVVFLMAGLTAGMLTGRGPLQIVLGLTGLAVALTYRLVGDGIFHGAGLGKRLFGIYVVDAKTRQPCSKLQALLRMCYQWVPLFGFIDAIVLVCDGLQRWGDQTARTYVLRRHPTPPPAPRELRPVDFAAIRESLKH